MNLKKLLFFVPMVIAFVNSNGQTKKQETKIEFEIFSDIPSAIDGCACVFSKNENDYNSKKYIFVNDFAKYAFVKINGKLEEFELVNNSEGKGENAYYVYMKGEIVLRIEITKKLPDGDESSKLIGKMILTNSNGLKTVVEFFGTCGC